MELENIELDTMSKQFEFEKRSREIEEITDIEELRAVTKAMFKLYLKQQEDDHQDHALTSKYRWSIMTIRSSEEETQQTQVSRATER